jgi:hypothetical protein
LDFLNLLDLLDLLDGAKCGIEENLFITNRRLWERKGQTLNQRVAGSNPARLTITITRVSRGYSLLKPFLLVSENREK